MVYLNYPTGNLKRRANVQLLYNNSKVQKQCTDLKIAKKLFGEACDGGEQMGCDNYKKLNQKGY